MTASPGRVVPIADRAAGCYIEAGGKRYLDACGGAMVMLLGHCHPRLVEALERQARELAFTYRFSFRNQPMLDLAERVATVAPGDLEWCFFNSSGLGGQRVGGAPGGALLGAAGASRARSSSCPG